MDNRQAYNAWSEIYDTNVNKTRDLEARALRTVLAGGDLGQVLELGCGTGKNTVWLAEHAVQVTAADFSEEMLARAKSKITAANTTFVQADLTRPWAFGVAQFDMATCSLVLEHIEDVDFIFGQVSRALRIGGRFYMGEFHPFRQYQGRKARFEFADGVLELDCFVHHVSEFFSAAQRHGLVCTGLREWFDDDDATKLPRILSMVFQKA